ncbi:MAG: hypothetical protein AAGJ52_09355, partial [Pseudomonadota bacterium]
MDDADQSVGSSDHRRISFAALALTLMWLLLVVPGVPGSAPVIVLGVGLALSAAFERWHPRWLSAPNVSLLAFALAWIIAALAGEDPALSASRSAAWLAGATILLFGQVRFRQADFLLIGTGLYSAGLVLAAAVLLHSHGADSAQSVVD